MRPPDRYANDSFETYRTQGPTQAAALEEAKQFVAYIKARQHWTQRIQRRLGLGRTAWKGLYLVGPVGTGKTHLLASMYHALQPEVPCAFLHSSALFRAQEHPEDYAQELAARYRVLCLDEVELDDPANEARLVLILKKLEDLGVILLATSNVEPEKFLSAELGNDRFRRFLNEEFRQWYRVVFVGGDDYRKRLAKPGRAWIGPAPLTRAAMQDVFEADARKKRWLDFDALRAASIATEHTRLVRELTGYESLYLEGIDVRHTDDALRLLRIIDDVYQAPRPPVLYFTSEQPLEGWFGAEAHGVLEKGVAEKFTRTTSRLRALCRIEHVAASQRLAG